MSSLRPERMSGCNGASSWTVGETAKLFNDWGPPQSCPRTQASGFEKATNSRGILHDIPGTYFVAFLKLSVYHFFVVPWLAPHVRGDDTSTYFAVTLVKCMYDHNASFWRHAPGNGFLLDALKVEEHRQNEQSGTP